MTDCLKEYTVSELVKEIQKTLDIKYFYVKVKGEITNFKQHFSGHLYFSLKEKDTIINITMFKNSAQYCKFNLQDGIEIIVSGRLSLYKERSNYQIIAEAINISGEGTLLKIIQETKERLEKEGLFDINRKRQIPKLPHNIGLITAKTGAAIQDILSRLKDRTPITFHLYSTLMQGKDAPQEIIQAINYFNNLPQHQQPQVIVITRGGGSIEDLMAFNDEKLVRAVANSHIPTISAIGHEIDWTLIDYASDIRLPTPTSVAEYLTISKEQAYQHLDLLLRKLCNLLAQNNNKKHKKLKNTFQTLIQKKHHTFLKRKYHINNINTHISNIIKLHITNYKNKLLHLKTINIFKSLHTTFTNKMNHLTLCKLKIQNTIKHFPILKDKNGNIIHFKKDIKNNTQYTLHFIDGEVNITIDKN